MISIDHAIEILNQAVEADWEAIQNLINYRVKCNSVLADHPTIQVGAIIDKTHACGKSEYNGQQFEIGLLGIINGLFGVDADGWGFIAAKYNDSGELTGFIRTPLR